LDPEIQDSLDPSAKSDRMNERSVRMWLEDILFGNLRYKYTRNMFTPAFKKMYQKSKWILFQDVTCTSKRTAGHSHGLSLHPFGRGFLSAQHLPPILSRPVRLCDAEFKKKKINHDKPFSDEDKRWTRDVKQ
jgi:hypothetical protein